MLTETEILQKKLTVAQNGRASAIANIAMQTANNAIMVNNYDIQISALEEQLNQIE